MTERVQIGGIQVAKNLYDFVNNEAIPGTGVDADKFWAEFDKIVNELAPRNRELLAKRDAIQEKMDSWNRDHKGQKLDMAEYKSFLKDIGYLVDEPSEFKISTSNVDPEVATMAGPQLVVPIMNARFALNAANARWVACTMPFTVPMRSPKKAAPTKAVVTTRFAGPKLSNGPVTCSTAPRLWPLAAIKMLPSIWLKVASWSSSCRMVRPPV